jgi:hypothetical protein
MLVFGMSGFYMAYANDGAPVYFLYMHGGFAIVVYTIFYLTIFGPGQVKWMFINASLGLLGIYAQINWLLSLFGKQAGDYPLSVHVIPFLYYILYTFLLYQLILDLSGARNNPQRRRLVENSYITISVLIYGVIYLRSP